jgi:hypothetical protein
MRHYKKWWFLGQLNKMPMGKEGHMSAYISKRNLWLSKSTKRRSSAFSRLLTTSSRRRSKIWYWQAYAEPVFQPSSLWSRHQTVLHGWVCRGVEYGQSELSTEHGPSRSIARREHSILLYWIVEDVLLLAHLRHVTVCYQLFALWKAKILVWSMCNWSKNPWEGSTYVLLRELPKLSGVYAS